MSQFITIRPVDYGVTVKVALGDGGAQLADNDAGWVTQARASNVSLVSWNGQEPVAQTVPIMIDGFREGKSVESDVDALRSLAGIGRTDFDGYSPTTVKIRGAIHFPRKHWVITGISEGDTLRLKGSGDLCRYQATLNLLEWINPDQIQLHKKAKHRGKYSPFIYTVKEGDTLTKIAQKVYGDKSKWKTIGDAQSPKLKSPSKKLKVGTKLKLPGVGGYFAFGGTTQLAQGFDS